MHLIALSAHLVMLIACLLSEILPSLLHDVLRVVAVLLSCTLLSSTLLIYPFSALHAAPQPIEQGIHQNQSSHCNLTLELRKQLHGHLDSVTLTVCFSS